MTQLTNKLKTIINQICGNWNRIDICLSYIFRVNNIFIFLWCQEDFSDKMYLIFGVGEILGLRKINELSTTMSRQTILHVSKISPQTFIFDSKME